MFLIYNLLLWLSVIILVPVYGAKIIFGGKYRRSIGPKLGVISPEPEIPGSPRIWLHAVSVGEVVAAAPIISSLREKFPQACIVLATTTETGQELARRSVGQASRLIYYPLDFPFIIRKYLNRLKPDIFVAVETEIWPNLIRMCRDDGTAVVLVNGRISPRSFRRYHATRFFWRRVLGMVDKIGAISDVDAGRLREIGVPGRRITVLGNTKFDSILNRVDRAAEETLRTELNCPPDQKVLVAGSTHPGEETAILYVFGGLLERYPDLKLILAPRHVDRAEEVLSLIRGNGFENVLTLSKAGKGSAIQPGNIILVDVIGELFRLYSLASVVYCGGSLVPRGGQNIIEPAAWGKVVFCGPHMEDFTDEKNLLESTGSLITVHNERELLQGILNLLENPSELSRRGEAAGRSVAASAGAARKYAELITSILEKRTRSERKV